MTTTPITRPERIPLAPAAAIGGAQVSTRTTFGPADILQALRQRIFLIFFLWMFFIGLTGGTTYLLWTKYPKFQAASHVLVESPHPELPFEMYQAEVTPQILTRFLLNQAMLARSPDVIANALQDVEVRQTQWFRNTPEEDLQKELTDQIVVVPVAGTSYLSIMMETRSQNDPHIIANAVTNAYLARAQDLSRSSLRQMMNDYRVQQDSLQRLVRDKVKEIDEFIIKLGAGATSVGGGIVMSEIARVTEFLVVAEADKSKAKGLFESYKAVGAQDVAVSPQLQQMIEQDPRIAGLQMQLYQLQEAEAFVLEELGQKNKQVRQLRTRIRKVDADLTEARTKKIGELREWLTEQAELEYLAALEQELSLRDRLLELKEQQKDLDQKLLKLARLDDEKRILDEKLSRMEGFTDQVNLVISGQRTVRVQMISKAERPLFPSFPNWLINMPLGTALGLAFSVGLALLLELVDTSVRAPVDMVRSVNVPLLGTVPDLDDEEVAIDQMETAVRTAPHSMVAEAFRSIRTNLFFSGPAERQRSILITSPRPEDGKTSVAVNLATVIAQSGRRVLLVDVNFRRPSLHHVFHLPDAEGLSNVLIGQTDFSSVVRSTDLPNLDVLVSGPIPPNPTEILSSTYMRDLLSLAIEQYDQVILDGPPVLLVSDALVLSTMLDGVILVVRAKVNSRGVAIRARELLNRVNAHIFGGVLNAAQVRRGGYFREQLRTFYDYQPEDASAALPADKGDKDKKDKKYKKEKGLSGVVDVGDVLPADDAEPADDFDLDAFFGDESTGDSGPDESPGDQGDK